MQRYHVFWFYLLSKWLQIDFFVFPPASANILMISKGASGSLPGWKLTGAPVASWAIALATMAFFSNSKMQCLQIWCFYSTDCSYYWRSKYEDSSSKWKLKYIFMNWSWNFQSSLFIIFNFTHKVCCDLEIIFLHIILWNCWVCENYKIFWNLPYKG